MKFESLEQEVHTMSDHLRSLERQRAELMAQILKLQPQDPGLSPFKSRLPVIDKASHSESELFVVENKLSRFRSLSMEWPARTHYTFERYVNKHVVLFSGSKPSP
jgi:hypothetical protein